MHGDLIHISHITGHRTLSPPPFPLKQGTPSPQRPNHGWISGGSQHDAPKPKRPGLSGNSHPHEQRLQHRVAVVSELSNLCPRELSNRGRNSEQYHDRCGLFDCQPSLFVEKIVEVHADNLHDFSRPPSVRRSVRRRPAAIRYDKTKKQGYREPMLRVRKIKRLFCYAYSRRISRYPQAGADSVNVSQMRR